MRLVRARDGLQVRRKQYKKRFPGSPEQLLKAEHPNHVWTYDFVFDRTIDGRRLKCLTVADEYTRQGLKIEVGRSLTSADVRRVLSLLFAIYGHHVLAQ